ncbi:MAG: beta-ketoacyl synthase chain length factor [Chitinophagales bacterium]
MIFIHHSAAISPQESFGKINLDLLHEYGQNKLHVIEPKYEGIPQGALRRMGKAVKIGVGAAISLLSQNGPVQGIIIGTAHGGLEDCIKFLNQIVEYEEGLLAPGNFVQSTANAIAAQLGMMTANKCYNITHVHRGLAFENALIDAFMLIREYPTHQYLIGGVDEISSYNFNIDRLDGWYKKEAVINKDLYKANSAGSMAGEGAAAFLVNGEKKAALATVEAIHVFHTREAEKVSFEISAFLKKYVQNGRQIDLLISGENGDCRMTAFYEACEQQMDALCTISRYKHMCGEYPTASAMALWLACQILKTHDIPQHMIKKNGKKGPVRTILIYNNFKEVQHSLVLVSGI